MGLARLLFVRLHPVEFLFRGIEVLPARCADPVVFGLAMATLPALFAFGHGLHISCRVRQTLKVLAPAVKSLGGS